MLILSRLFLIIILSIILGYLTQKIVKLLEHFCHLTGLRQFAAASVFIALATSLPELSVSTLSAINGFSELSYGNAIGSNLVNIALVMGLTAIAGRHLLFNHTDSRFRVYSLLPFTFLPFIFALDLHLSSFEGFILVFVFLIYILRQLRQPPPVSAASQKPSETARLLHPRSLKILFHLFFLILLLITDSLIIVYLAKSLAISLALPPLFIGLFVVAIGTSLPELAFNLRSVKTGHPGMATANVVGSCLTNSTLIIGLSALIRPITLTSFQQLSLPAVEYLLILILFVYFINSKKRLDAWEGVVLVAFFFYYTCLELWVK